jgi:site-specific DNA-methyltransferase (cytosine-N4-specific)
LSGRPNAATSPQGFGVKRGLPAKNLAGMPWRVALALQSRGWILRAEIIWHKPNAIPESVKDRPARRHEHLFLLTSSPRYFFDLDPIREPYTGDRSLTRRRHRSANKPHTITTPLAARRQIRRRRAVHPATRGEPAAGTPAHHPPPARA